MGVCWLYVSVWDGDADIVLHLYAVSGGDIVQLLNVCGMYVECMRDVCGCMTAVCEVYGTVRQMLTSIYML